MCRRVYANPVKRVSRSRRRRRGAPSGAPAPSPMRIGRQAGPLGARRRRSRRCRRRRRRRRAAVPAAPSRHGRSAGPASRHPPRPSPRRTRGAASGPPPRAGRARGRRRWRRRRAGSRGPAASSSVSTAPSARATRGSPAGAPRRAAPAARAALLVGRDPEAREQRVEVERHALGVARLRPCRARARRTAADGLGLRAPEAAVVEGDAGRAADAFAVHVDEGAAGVEEDGPDVLQHAELRARPPPRARRRRRGPRRRRGLRRGCAAAARCPSSGGRRGRVRRGPARRAPTASTIARDSSSGTRRADADVAQRLRHLLERRELRERAAASRARSTRGRARSGCRRPPARGERAGCGPRSRRRGRRRSRP